MYFRGWGCKVQAVVRDNLPVCAATGAPDRTSRARRHVVGAGRATALSRSGTSLRELATRSYARLILQIALKNTYAGIHVQVRSKKTMHCYTYMRYLLRVSGTKMRAQLSITYTVGGDAKRRPHQLVLGRRDAHERILDHVPSPTSHLRPNRETPATDENFVPASASEHRQDGKVSTRGRRPGTLSR